MVKTAEVMRRKADEAFEEAVMANEIAQGMEQEAQQLLAAHKEKSAQITNNLEALEKALAEAEKSYDAAKNELVESHKRGTNMLQVMEMLERGDFDRKVPVSSDLKMMLHRLTWF